MAQATEQQSNPVAPHGQQVGGQQVAGTQAVDSQGAFPPFDSATYPSAILWLFVTFGVLYLAMARYALPRIESILKMRSARIHADLAAAHKMRDEANHAADAYEKTLATARRRSQDLAAETKAKVKLEQEKKRETIEVELSARLLAAEERISTMKTNAMANVSQIAQEAASAIVEHFTGRPADHDAVVKALVEARG